MQRHNDEWEFLFNKLKAENELMRSALKEIDNMGVLYTDTAILDWDGVIKEARECLTKIEKGD